MKKACLMLGLLFFVNLAALAQERSNASTYNKNHFGNRRSVGS